MLNEPPNRNSSDQKQSVKLRIPSVSPIFTISMLIVGFLTFLARFRADALSDVILQRLGIQGAAVLEQYQLYRLFTAQILLEQFYPPLAYLGIIQALLSLYTLYIVGSSMERLWGNTRFALVYVLGGTTGAIVSLLLVASGVIPADIYLVTAPNAILAVLGAEWVYMFKHRRLYTRQGQLRRNYLIGLAVLNLIVGAFVARVDLFGLLGGLVGGGILATIISPLHLPRPHPDEPGALLGEDVNPLHRRTLMLTLYASVLASALLLGARFAIL